MFLKIIAGILFTLFVVTFFKKARNYFLRSKTAVSSRNIARCVHCGIYIPENESVKKGDEVFCSESHANGEDP